MIKFCNVIDSSRKLIKISIGSFEWRNNVQVNLIIGARVTDISTHFIPHLIWIMLTAHTHRIRFSPHSSMNAKWFECHESFFQRFQIFNKKKKPKSIEAINFRFWSLVFLLHFNEWEAITLKRKNETYTHNFCCYVICSFFCPTQTDFI